MLEARIRALVEDRARGSAALADEALAILAEAARAAPPAERRAALDGVAARLAAARPAMVAVENRVHQVMAALHAADAPPEALADIAEGLCAESRLLAARARDAAAAHAARVLPEGKVLAVSWSDTVARALELAARSRPVQVVVPAGEPLGDGRRAAQRYALAGMEVELVPDAAVGRASLDCAAGLAGADAVLADGTVVNRAGTSLAALAMGLGARPFLVVCESAKVTWRETLPMEEGPGAQVGAPGPMLPVRVRNPLFDATPPALVRAYCTDAGTLTASDLPALAEQHRSRADAWGFLDVSARHP